MHRVSAFVTATVMLMMEEKEEKKEAEKEEVKEEVMVMVTGMSAVLEPPPVAPSWSMN